MPEVHIADARAVLHKLADWYEEDPRRWIKYSLVERAGDALPERCCAIGGICKMVEPAYSADLPLPEFDLIPKRPLPQLAMRLLAASILKVEPKALNTPPWNTVWSTVVRWNNGYCADAADMIAMLRAC